MGGLGSGKSNLLNTIGLLDNRDEVQFLIDGVERKSLTEKEQAANRSSLCGYLFQDFVLVENEAIFKNLRIPLIYSKIEKANIK